VIVESTHTATSINESNLAQTSVSGKKKKKKTNKLPLKVCDGFLPQQKEEERKWLLCQRSTPEDFKHTKQKENYL
jgi:hypothetical protein